MNSEMFWNASIEDLKRGFTLDKQNSIYTCILCDETFEKGRIYPIGDLLFDAEKAIAAHVEAQHKSVFDFLLGLGRIYTGLSDGQAELAQLFYQGFSDKEIVKITNANSASTIRNQRFSIREKYKQAKVTVALVEIMEERMEYLKQEQKNIVVAEIAAEIVAENLVDIHPKATCVDERFAITQEEKELVLKRYFDSDNKLLIKGFPAKEKRKIIIMQKIIKDFKANRNYSEQEVNELIKNYYEDYATVRRYLVQYGFLDRDKEGKNYWIK